MRALSLSLPLFAALCLSACGEEPNDGMPGEEGAQVEYAPTGASSSSEEQSSSIKGPEGEEAIAKSGGDNDSSLPKGFSIYPGAKVVENTSVAEPGGQSSVTMMLESTDGPEKIASYYKDLAEKAGMEIKIDMALDTSHTVGGDRDSDGAKMTVSATREPASEATEVMLNLVQGPKS
ncbi:MAG: hypothetical protein ABJP70_07850 [Erythrobacter sp.]